MILHGGITTKKLLGIACMIALLFTCSALAEKHFQQQSPTVSHLSHQADDLAQHRNLRNDDRLHAVVFRL